VRSDDFMAWWIAGGRDLFKEPEVEGVQVIKETMGEHRPQSNILLSVPFTGDLDRTVKEIRALLEPEFAALRLKRGPSLARYPVASKPVLSNLYLRWRVLRRRVWCSFRTPMIRYSVNLLRFIRYPSLENRLTSTCGRFRGAGHQEATQIQRTQARGPELTARMASTTFCAAPIAADQGLPAPSVAHSASCLCTRVFGGFRGETLCSAALLYRTRGRHSGAGLKWSNRHTSHLAPVSCICTACTSTLRS
jgi:hypothetical protein